MSAHYWAHDTGNRLSDEWLCIDCGIRWTTNAIQVHLPDGRSFLAKQAPAGYIITSDIEQHPGWDAA